LGTGNNKGKYKKLSKSKGKGNAVPLQGWSGPEASRTLRFLDFMTKTHEGVSLSAPHTGRIYPPKCCWYIFLLEAEFKPAS